MVLYIDTETLPTVDEKLIARVIADIKAPDNYKDPKKIKAYIAEKAVEAVAKTSLDGAYGRLCAIGFAAGDGDIECYTAVDPAENGLPYTQFNEADLLHDFFQRAHELVRADDCNVTIVGHNVVGFDLRFIYQRSLVCRVSPPPWWPINPKPWSTAAYDTMLEWAGPHDRVSLDKLCLVLGFSGKGDIDGSKVAGIWAAGQYGTIRAYCADDVQRARWIARQMMPVIWPGDRRAA
jgi:hypothetical protein